MARTDDYTPSTPHRAPLDPALDPTMTAPVPTEDATDGGGGSGWRPDAPPANAATGPLAGEVYDPRNALTIDSSEPPIGRGLELAPGRPIGRFTILERLGVGGMGEVVAAYDPQLDRKVAIKVLRGDTGASEGSARGVRLLREAQAMAKVVHPSVIVVHEVGTVGGRVFVAMEFMGGGTLRQWLRAETRAPAQILDTLIRAGRGLAAAHAAGLVHRDFKPDNVLLGLDGSVRVCDFGLVGVAGAPTGELANAPAPTSPLAASLTRTGAVLGTPAYMAPEQRRAESVDARADQFSYCVTLYEALYGARPFAGDTLDELDENVCAGNVIPPRTGARVPARVRVAVLRGLRPNPAERFASMDELLARLQPDTRRRRMWGILAGVAVVALLGVALANGSWGRASEVCRGAGERVAAVWNADRSRAIREAFAATGRGTAEAVHHKTAAALDAYAERWQGMYTDACEATQVRGDQSQALLDLRMACLGRRLDGMGALVDLFAREVDAETMNRAVVAAGNLRDVADCADGEALSAAVPPPTDAAAQARLAELRRRFDELEAMKLAGKDRDAQAPLTELVADVRAFDYAPLSAQVLYLLGSVSNELRLADEALAAYREALAEAAKARDDALAVRIWAGLLWTEGLTAGHREAALGLRPYAEAALARAGGQPRLEARLLDVLGILLNLTGAHSDAQSLHERALELAGGLGEAEDVFTANIHNSLAIDLSDQGDYEGAKHHYEQALAIQERKLGGQHPTTAGTLNGLANIAFFQKQPEQSRAYDERALAIYEAALGPNHPAVGRTLGNLADLVDSLGDHDTARRYFERTMSIYETTFGAEHPRVAFPLTGLAGLLMRSHKPAEALPLFERALAIREAGAEQVGLIGEARYGVARALWESGGDRERARAQAKIALDELTRAGAHKAVRRDEVETWLRGLGAK